MKEKARLTLNMSQEEHKYLKMATAQMGVSMRKFLLQAAFERLEEIEDEWLAQKARETLKAGKEKNLSWTEMKKRVL